MTSFWEPSPLTLCHLLRGSLAHNLSQWTVPKPTFPLPICCFPSPVPTNILPSFFPVTNPSFYFFLALYFLPRPCFLFSGFSNETQEVFTPNVLNFTTFLSILSVSRSPTSTLLYLSGYLALFCDFTHFRSNSVSPDDSLAASGVVICVTLRLFFFNPTSSLHLSHTLTTWGQNFAKQLLSSLGHLRFSYLVFLSG